MGLRFCAFHCHNIDLQIDTARQSFPLPNLRQARMMEIPGGKNLISDTYVSMGFNGGENFTVSSVRSALSQS